MPPQTICKGVCKLHPIHKICQGCYRSPLEIKIWLSASDTTKQSIIDKCALKQELYGDINTNDK